MLTGSDLWLHFSLYLSVRIVYYLCYFCSMCTAHYMLYLLIKQYQLCFKFLNFKIYIYIYMLCILLLGLYINSFNFFPLE